MISKCTFGENTVGNFDIGDIVRVVAASDFHLSVYKREFVNKIGFIVKFDERYNDFSGFYVRFFDSGQTILFNKQNLMKESEFMFRSSN